MKAHRDIVSLSVEIPRKHALRLLGAGKGKERPFRESVEEIFESEYEIASRLVEPKAAMRLSHAGLPGSGTIEPKMPLVAAVCTIGSALEERVSRLFDKGETVRAVVLDAIGSAAAEEAADRCNLLICEMATPTDFSPDRRSSPGYGGWSVEEQKAIFGFVRPDEINVTLTESCMMIPRKSVSFVVPLEGGKPGGGRGSRCSRCGIDDCPYRDVDDENADWCDLEEKK